MDELLFALIESEREAEEDYAVAVANGTDGPDVVICDGEGFQVQVYPDGSYCTRNAGGVVI